MTGVASVDPGYRHQAKTATSGPGLALGATYLKWYALAPADASVPDPIEVDARAFLQRLHADGGIDLTDDRGFVILHRCGESFYFLLVSVWRGSNELWEAVYYSDAGMTGFAPFDPAYPASGPRPTFCVWELGIVTAEADAWTRFLRSPRTVEDDRAWRDLCFEGVV